MTGQLHLTKANYRAYWDSVMRARYIEERDFCLTKGITNSLGILQLVLVLPTLDASLAQTLVILGRPNLCSSIDCVI